MIHDRNRVLTLSGKMIPLHDPQPEDILIHDIAQGLSNVRRWVGQTRRPISGWPIKQMLPKYKRLEAVWLRTIMDAMGLPHELPAWLPGVDMAMAVAESKQLMPVQTHAYIAGVAAQNGFNRTVAEGHVPIFNWSAGEAYRWFLQRYHELEEQL